jgi:flavin-dependent dehydrogenase
MGGPQVTVSYEEPVSYGIRRCEFDEYLLRRCGAQLQLGAAVNSLEYEPASGGGRWCVNGAITAPMLIGAGGHFCPVARRLNGGDAKAPRRECVVAAQEIEFRMTAEQARACTVSGREPQLFFCRDLAGYAWCFRKGDYLNVGLGREDNERLAAHVQQFVDDMKERGRIPRDMPDRMHGHSYILYGHTQRTLLGDGVLLIGDAAGLAYPQSGEGIRTAIESGLLAAQTVLEARGSYARQRLTSYETRLHERFGKPKAANGPSLVPAALTSAAAGLLLRSRWFVRSVVIDRWFLHRDGAPNLCDLLPGT